MAEESLTPERVTRRDEIKRLTDRGSELYAALQTNADTRAKLVALEMAEEGVVANDLTKLTGLTVARIYKLRDNGLKLLAKE